MRIQFFVRFLNLPSRVGEDHNRTWLEVKASVGEIMSSNAERWISAEKKGFVVSAWLHMRSWRHARRLDLKSRDGMHYSILSMLRMSFFLLRMKSRKDFCTSPSRSGDHVITRTLNKRSISGSLTYLRGVAE